MGSSRDAGRASCDGEKSPFKCSNQSGINHRDPPEGLRFTFNRTPNVIPDPYCSIAFRRSRSVIPSWDIGVPASATTSYDNKEERSQHTNRFKRTTGAGTGYWLNNNPRTIPWNDSNKNMPSDTMYRTAFGNKNILWRELVGITLHAPN
jgi:hypothetical protein